MKAIVIIANGWNAGWLGCNGNEWLLTPQIDRLATESVIFDQHFAVNPAPDGWQQALLSGRFSFGDVGGSSLLDALRKAGTWTVRIQDVRAPSSGEGWDVAIATKRFDDAPPGEALSNALSAQLIA